MVAVSDDKRLFERFSARFPTRFKDSRNDYGSDIFLRDASASGVRVFTKERQYIHDHVSLEVELPDGKSPMEISGEIKWSRLSSNNMWETGVEFHKIRLMSVQRLFEHVTEVE